MSDPAVRVAVRPDRVAVLTIDQPGAKVNVLTVGLWAELEAALDALPPDLAGLVIASGKPGCFIAGADLKVFAAATSGDPAVRAFIEQGLRVLAKLEALPFPTCAAIDGVALGGGLEVALACEFRSFGVRTKMQLGMPEVKLGLIPGWGGTQRLPRIVGLETALDMLLTGDPIHPGVAGPKGLFESAVDGEGVLDDAVTLVQIGRRARPSRRVSVSDAHTPRSPDTTAAREAYRVATEGVRLPLADGIRLETEAFLRLAGSDESRAKIAAFFATRKR